MSNTTVIGVGVDRAEKTIRFMENFNHKRSHEYIEVCKKLLTISAESISNYKIVFNDKDFKDMVALAKACSDEYEKELDSLLNPKLDTQALQDLGILSLSFEDKLVEVEGKFSLPKTLSLICKIPTLLPLKIKKGNKLYKNVVELAKEALADLEMGDLIDLTNSFAKELEAVDEDDDE